MRNLNNLLEPIRAEMGLPALAAAVIEKNKLVALGAVGKRRVDRDDPVRREDRFHIGSCTKSMTATLIARLVEMGRLDWGSMVAEVLLDIRKGIRRDYWKVTLEQLLTHRSGLPDDRTPHPQVFTKLWSLSAKQRLQAAEVILQQEPVAQPGEKTIYSNGGYVVAGTMAEVVTGKTWEELMQEHLFRPLGIKSAGFGAPTDGVWGHRSGTGGYLPVPPSPFADNPPVLGPAGTVHLSMPDWARYAILHLRGATDENPPLLCKTSFARLHTPPDAGAYAMGWGVTQPEWARGRVLQHAGSNTMWFAQILLVPYAGAGFLVATNAADERARDGVHRVMDVLREGRLK
ncbi:Putative penicillin-binding protein PbpX [bacterium HR16]|nr:Putative penicillin-binding protein PbpX [bacterium HR16]